MYFTAGLPVRNSTHETAEWQIDEWELQVLSVSGGSVVVDMRVDARLAQVDENCRFHEHASDQMNAPFVKRLASIYLCGHLKHIMSSFELLSMDVRPSLHMRRAVSRSCAHAHGMRLAES